MKIDSNLTEDMNIIDLVFSCKDKYDEFHFKTPSRDVVISYDDAGFRTCITVYPKNKLPDKLYILTNSFQIGFTLFNSLDQVMKESSFEISEDAMTTLHKLGIK